MQLYIFTVIDARLSEWNLRKYMLATTLMENFQSLQTLLFLFSSIILMIFIHLKFPFYLRTKKNLPPSPRKLPIIGNIHQLGSCPHRSLHALSQKHGPLMLLHFGSVATLVASSAKVAQEILKTHDLSFCSRPNLNIISILIYGCKDIAFSPYGEYWRQLKSVAVLHLLSNTRVKSFQKVREQELGLVIGMLEKSSGSLVDISALLFSFSNRIACKVAMGRTYDGSKLIHLLKHFFDLLTVVNVGTFIPWLRWVDRLSGLVGRAEKNAKEFDEFLESIIEEHVNNRTGDGSGSEEEQNFIDILLDVQKEKPTGFTFHRDSIKAVILDMFAGGTETTSTTMEMAISELVRNPRVMKKVQIEVTEIAQGKSMIAEEDLEKLHYLKAVIKESLRLHPPVPLLPPRISTQDVKLMGYDIPAGTQVMINAWAIGRDPDSWEEPTEFKPERFLTNPMNYKGQHFEWVPFGAGRRECPGIQFSVAIIELALANIVYKFDLELPKGVKDDELDMSEAYGIVARGKPPLMIIPKPRC